MKINEVMTVDIFDTNNFANGIAKCEGFTIFVPLALIDEKVSIKIIKITKKYAIGKLLKVIKKSPLRCTVSCPYYGKCGGCAFMHTTIDNENKIKGDYLKKIFPKYLVKDVISDDDLYYRNKVSLHVKNNRLGFYNNKSNDLVSIDNCLLLDKRINQIIDILKKMDLKDNTNIIIRVAKTTGESLIKFNSMIDITPLKEITSIYVNDKLIYGNKYIKEIINGITYTIYPNAFFQVNTLMMIRLYDEIKKSISKEDSLLDLYCGTGSIGIYLKDNFKKVLGVEISSESILNALLNKDLNNLNNIDFINEDASNIKNDAFNSIVVDPPRSGLTKELITKLLKLKAKQIIYISCDPNTLKRDLDLLTKNYEVKEITPFNMFLRTYHVECLCVLNIR